MRLHSRVTRSSYRVLIAWVLSDVKKTVSLDGEKLVLFSEPDQIEMTVWPEETSAEQDEFLKYLDTHKWPSGFWNQYKTLTQRNFTDATGRFVKAYVVGLVRTDVVHWGRNRASRCHDAERSQHLVDEPRLQTEGDRTNILCLFP